jgi:hypothetical protein
MTTSKQAQEIIEEAMELRRPDFARWEVQEEADALATRIDALVAERMTEAALLHIAKEREI